MHFITIFMVVDGLSPIELQMASRYLLDVFFEPEGRTAAGRQVGVFKIKYCVTHGIGEGGGSFPSRRRGRGGMHVSNSQTNFVD